MTEKYDIDSIESLSFKEGVRLRVSMYLGSSDIEGTYQAFKEIVNNSTDEALVGYGKRIEISVKESINAVRIRDFGRGCPFGTRENGENVLVSTFTKSHTGGKFNSKSYANVSGLNGIGGSCVCLSSKWFDVFSYRDGKMAHALFKEGELFSYIEENTKLPNGTCIEFSPDEKVFNTGEIGYSFDRICNDIKNISYLYPGIVFVLTDEDNKKKVEYCAKNGIQDFITDTLKSPLQKHIMMEKVSDDNDELEIAFQWGSSHETSYVFVNGLQCPEGGSPITGAKTAITKTFNSLTGESFDGESIRKNLFYVINCRVKQPSFSNQTKSKINNSNLRTLASNAFTKALKEMKARYPDEFKTIYDLLRKIERAEAAADRARQAILNHEQKEREVAKKKVLLPDKFKDCEKHGQESTLIICEGNSALSGIMPARSIQSEALYAVRGKVKNLLKAPLEECLDNQEISDIISILGCGIQEKYRSSKLNYGKVAICTDGDVDGYSIMCLIATMFYVLMPKFIEEDRLCWLRAPLFKLEKGNNRLFAYNEKELSELKKKYPNYTQGRNKGLGEMTATDMEESMFHPVNRRIEVLSTSDLIKSGEVFELLMGKNVEPRKNYLFENADFEEVML